MTRMMLAASSASGSWQYLFANTKQASASWTLFFFLNRRQQNSNDQPICFFFLIIKKYKKSMSKIVFVCLFVFQIVCSFFSEIAIKSNSQRGKSRQMKRNERSRGICKDEVVFQGEEAIEWWKIGKKKSDRNHFKQCKTIPSAFDRHTKDRHTQGKQEKSVPQKLSIKHFVLCFVEKSKFNWTIQERIYKDK